MAQNTTCAANYTKNTFQGARANSPLPNERAGSGRTVYRENIVVVILDLAVQPTSAALPTSERANVDSSAEDTDCRRQPKFATQNIVPPQLLLTVNHPRNTPPGTRA